MIQRLAVLTILASAVAWCTVVVLDRFDAAGGRVRMAQGEPDEGWRRTTAGWERLAPRILAWHSSSARHASSAAGPEAPLPESESVFRWDFHPVIFALLLVSAAAAAFGLFPGRRAVNANRRSQSLF